MNRETGTEFVEGYNQKLIYTASLNLEVRDYGEGADQVKNTVKEGDG
ncbi:hypothetical protein [Paenibacillus larvae]|nr:hypothetical protein [Paenibacillus larvae]MDR5601631.1 hypothetical protein [Paenibacillus larvae]